MKKFKEFSKALGVFVWAMATLATSANAFNGTESFYVVTGILSIIGTGIGIYFIKDKLK